MRGSGLRQAEALLAQGTSRATAAKQIGISEQTYDRWKKAFGQMIRDQLGRLKALEKENARLKELVAEQALDLSLLKEVVREDLGTSGDLPSARRAGEMPFCMCRRRCQP